MFCQDCLFYLSHLLGQELSVNDYIWHLRYLDNFWFTIVMLEHLSHSPPQSPPMEKTAVWWAHQVRLANGELCSQNTILVSSNDTARCKQNCWAEVNKIKSLVWRFISFSSIETYKKTSFTKYRWLSEVPASTLYFAKYCVSKHHFHICCIFQGSLKLIHILVLTVDCLYQGLELLLPFKSWSNYSVCCTGEPSWDPMMQVTYRHRTKSFSRHLVVTCQ